MPDAPHYYAHTHMHLTHDGEHAAMAGNCGQFGDHVNADERIQYLLHSLEAARQASAVCYPGSTTEIIGNVYEGYIVRDTWAGSCGHESVAEARLFLSQEPCDPRTIQSEQDALARLAAD